MKSFANMFFVAGVFIACVSTASFAETAAIPADVLSAPSPFLDPYEEESTLRRGNATGLFGPAEGGKIVLAEDDYSPPLSRSFARRSTAAPQSFGIMSVGPVGAISAGAYHVVAIKTDGTVWAWGENSTAQLGGSVLAASQARPEQVVLPGTATPEAVSAGGFHTLVLMDDGTVVAFGDNSAGQLGNGGTGNGPVAVSGLTDVIAVAAGGYHSLALKSDGTVWVWGTNTNGQLGTGTSVEAVPVQVSGLTGIVGIGAGSFASYAVKGDGTAVAWGSNSSGQLGDGSYTDQPAPVAVFSLTDVVAIAGGWNHAAALKSDGTVWCWGDNWSGQLGDWYFGGSGTPVQAWGVADAVAIATGSNHTLAKLSDGSMWSWGGNFNGQLGTGEAWVSFLNFDPLPSMLESGVEQVSAGGYTTFALRGDGTVSGFGYVEYGQMGDGQWQGKPYPVQVHGLTDGASATGGLFHSVVALGDGAAGWVGYYNTNNLYVGGRDPNDQSYQLKLLSGLGGVIQVDSGDDHTLALLSNGTVWSWGIGGAGQLGTGGTATNMTATQIAGLSGIVQVSAGGYSSLAVKSDGTVWMWGANDFAQLGDGTTTPRDTPAQVAGLDDVAVAVLGSDHAVAVKNDGSVWVWGNNAQGQLLAGAGTVVSVPTQVPGLYDVVELAAGEGYTLARKLDDTVVGWGLNSFGQLGLGDWSNRSWPGSLALSGVKEIAAGTRHGLARLADGTLRAWGNNSLGQVGDGTFEHRNTPVAVTGLSDVRRIGAGFLHSLAIKQDGSVWAWGNNGNEQLGVSVSLEHRPALRLLPDPADTDGDGLPDAWEMAHFGTLSRDGTGDADGDGWSDIQEYLQGTSPVLADSDGDGFTDVADSAPLDFYNGLTPVIEVIDGDDQNAPTSTVLQDPLVVRVKNSIGTPLVNAPVRLEVATGGARFGLSADQTQLTLLDARTDATGLVTIWARTADAPGASELTATASGTAQSVVFDIETDPVVASPILRPSPGGYVFNQFVTITDDTPGSTIRHALEDREVLATDDEIVSGDGLLLSASQHISARGFKAGLTASPTVGGEYTIMGHAGSGSDHLLVALADGTVWASGFNDRGQLGNATTTMSTQLRVVPGLSGVVSVAAGHKFSLALSGGAVWAWGANDQGQLGDGTTTDRLMPVPVSGLSDVRAIGAGESFAVAIKNDGSVWAWGANNRGQLGDGTTSPSGSPVQVAGISTAVAVAAGGNFVIVAKEDGTVLAWGANDLGQLGDGTTTDRLTPVSVTGLAGIRFVAAGGAHALAGSSDGTVWAWGANDRGQLGDGTTMNRSVPVVVGNVSKIQRLAAAGGFSFAVSAGNRLYGWGANDWKQLQLPPAASLPLPQELTAVADVTFVDGGGRSVVGIKSDGAIVAWHVNGLQTIGSLLEDDVDGDGLTNAWEVQNGLNPSSADTDGDGMPDGWEVEHGLDPARSDRFGDADGDGVPNHYEYLSGSEPDDSLSVPATIRRVDTSDVNAYQTIQAAINDADPGDMILIVSGVYSGSGNRGLSISGKPLWIVGEGGSGAVTIDCEGSYNGISSNSDLTVVGITVRRSYSTGIYVYNGAQAAIGDVRFTEISYSSGYAIRLNSAEGFLQDIVVENGNGAGLNVNGSRLDLRGYRYLNNRGTGSNGALYVSGESLVTLNDARFTDNRISAPLVTFYGEQVEARVSNSVVLRNDTASSYLIYNYESDTSFDHVTMSGNRSAGTSYGHVYLSSATFGARNSIFHNDAAKPEFYNGTPTLSHVIVRGGGTGTAVLDLDPKLTGTGHLRHDSPAIDAGFFVSGLDRDIDGESRPTGIAADIGADEWVVSSSNPQMPAWFVDKYGLASSGGDADGDGLSDVDEYLAGTDPTSVDTDGDGLTDGDESTLGSNPLRADSDNDGMPDGWEIDHGLDPTVDDGFADLDGDGIPNLFEYLHGSDPDDALSMPAAQREVNPSDPGAYQTIQAAINAAAAYDIIRIAPGTYSGSGNRDMSTSNKPLLLVGTGGSSDVVIDAAMVSNGISSNVDLGITGMTFLRPYQYAVSVSNGRVYLRDVRVRQTAQASGETIRLNSARGTLADILIEEGKNGGLNTSASNVVVRNYTYRNNVATAGNGALYAYGASDVIVDGGRFTDNRLTGYLMRLDGNTTQVRVVNSVMLRNETTSSYLIYNNQATTSFDHVTLAGNRSAGTSYGHLYLSGSGFTAQNSIFHNDASKPEFYNGTPTLSHVIVRGGGTGTAVLDTDPKLTATGHLRYDSPAIDAGLAITGLDWDIDGELRPTGTAADIGADEWVVSSTNPQLPAWFVDGYGLASSGGDADGDGLSDLDEYLAGTNPTEADSDGDGLNDGVENTLGTNPLRADSDNDGMPDGWEVDHGLEPLVDDAFADLDGDGIPNLFEYLHGSDPDDALSMPAAQREVNPSDPGAYQTIQAAINAAAAYDIIRIAPGTYSGSGNRGLNTNGKPVLLIGAGGSAGVVIDGESGYNGVAAANTDLALVGVTFLRPSQYAVSMSNGRVYLRDIQVRGTANDWGDAIQLSSVRGVLEDILIEEGRNGGLNAGASRLLVKNYGYRNNAGSGGNGALYVSGASSVTLDGARITDNRITTLLVNLNGNAAQVEMVNSVMLRNETTSSYLIYNNQATTSFDHVTLAGNRSAGTSYGHLYLSGSGFTAQNSIFHNDASKPEFFSAAPVLSHVIVRGGGTGTAVLDTDPKLTATGHLRHDSPAIDAGLAITGLDWDIDDELRPTGTAADIGADEWVVSSTHPQLPAWFVDGYGLASSGGDADGDGLSDLDEYLAGTNPAEADTDGDGLTDGAESTLGSNPLRADSDNDGMPDGWEVDHGLDPMANDAFSDLDGDGIPNLFEYLHGSDPDDALSMPTAQREVNPSDPGAYQTIQAAITAASAYDIIQIAPGTYSGNGNRGLSTNTKPVLLRGTGGSASVVIDTESGYNGISANADLSLVGITFLRPYQYAVSVSNGRVYLRDVRVRQTAYASGETIRLNTVSGTLENILIEEGKNGGMNAAVSRVAIRNYVYRNNIATAGNGALYVSGTGGVTLDDARFTDNRLTGYLMRIEGSGAQLAVTNAVMLRNETTSSYLIYNQATTTFDHVTLAGNRSAGTSYGHLYLSGSGFSAQNSIFHNDASKPEFYSGTPALSHVIVRGGGTGTAVLNVDPKLTGTGHLRHDSPAIDAGLAIAGLDWDIDGENRPTGTAVDIGADEWVVSSTHAQLPAWFVDGYGLASSGGDADGDGLSDLDEYLAGTNPTATDTDGDGLTDGQEHTLGSDPLRTDSDNDGMPDGWETANGLDPVRDDALADLDGDGIPNLFEYLHGSDPDDALSVPTAQREVNPSDPGAHQTIQAAINAAVAYDIIQIAPGTYSGNGNRGLSTSTKPVLLIGQGGSAGVVIDVDSGYNGISAGADLGLVGITFLHPYQSAVTASNGRVYLRDIRVSQTTYASGAAIQLSSARGVLEDVLIEEAKNGGLSASASTVVARNYTYRNNVATAGNGALYAYGASDVIVDGGRFTDNRLTGYLMRLDGNTTQVRVVNSVMLRNETTSSYLIYNNQAATSFNHVTLAGNRSAGTSYGHLYLSGSGFTAQNSIFHNDASKPEFYNGTPTLSHVIVRGGGTGTAVLDTDPKLTASGHLRHDSPAIDAGLAITGLDWDIDGELRPTGMAADIGADEWVVSSTHPQLPAWFVDDYGLASSGGDADGDGLSDLDEYLAGTNPTEEDTDGDGLTDGEEHILGSNPLRADSDNDGMPDGWEVDHGLDPTQDDAFADLDGDGIPNLFEYRHGSDPDDALSVPAAQLQVDPVAGGAYRTIQAAINAAVAYDIIHVSPGVYTGNGNWNLSVYNKPVLLIGQGGSADVVIDAGSNYGGISASGDLAFVGFTILRPGQDGVYANAGRVFLKDVHIRESQNSWNNTIRFDSVSGSLENIRITSGQSGGIYLYSSGLTLKGYTYWNNHGNGGDGALFVVGTSVLAVDGARITDNRLAVELASFSGSEVQVDLVNSVMLRNETTSSYLIYNYLSATSFNHVTMAGNRSEDTYYGHLYLSGSGFSAQNSIFYNDASKPEFDGTAPTLSHVIVRGGGTGTAVLNVDPKLTGSGHLRYDSPAIDAGLAITGLDWDIDGESRPAGIAVDIGADEWVVSSTNPQLPEWFVDGYDLSGSGGDADGDGLSDLDEYLAGTNPTATDTDGDGLSDGQEVTLGTNPHATDTDGDGMLDGWEVAYGYDPTVSDLPGSHVDTDGDGVPDVQEAALGTNPLSADTDGDGMPDGWELLYGFNPLVNDGHLDRDRDGLSNLLEYQTGTRPDYFDTDGDLLPDGFEYYSAYLDPLVPNGLHDDFDGDGLTTFQEMTHGTNPDVTDTDGDGISDYDEIQAGSDPLDPNSKPFNPSDFFGAPINDANAQPIGDLGTFYVPNPTRFSVQGSMGDNSGSYSERWKLHVNEKQVVNEEFGKVEPFSLPLHGKRTWEISLSHVATNGEGSGYPDYDYYLNVSDAKGFLLSDPDSLQGTYEMANEPPNYWENKRAYLAPIKSLGYSESYSGSDAVGPRYRKVSLDGRPLPDEKPEEEAETEIHKEETYVDAFDLGLRHDTSYIYTPLAASELILEANASVRETTWSNRGGLRPHEELTSPFGIAWSSNLTAYIEVVEPLGDNTPDPITVNVVDEGGRSQRFGTEDLQTFFPWPSSRVDKKTFLNRLVKDGGALVLHKKYGSKLTYRPSKAWFMYSNDRLEGSESARRHTYWRLEKVEDKYGNVLHYDYGTAEVSLIPERIYSNNRMGQRLLITRSADSRRILSITDARGYTVTFNYSTGSAGEGLFFPYTRLDSVTYPDGTTQSYTYEIVSDVETVDDRVTTHYHANLKSITDKRGNTHAFNYRFDRTKEYFAGNTGRAAFAVPITHLPGNVQDDLLTQLADINSEGSGGFNYRTQYGVPRQVASVVLPGGIGTSQFDKTSGTRLRFGPEFSATSGTLVTDAVGNTTTYDFTGVHGEIVDVDQTFNNSGSSSSTSVSIEWMVYYTTMVIHHGAYEGQFGHLGKETFEYDLTSGLSLKRMIDMSGNETTWTFGDALPAPVVKLENSPNFMTAWADPTSKTDALGRTETYAYGDYRIMTTSVDVHGTTTTTAVDSLGRRKSLVVTDAANEKLREETYLYDDEDGDPLTNFAGFMVEKRVKAFANHSGQTWEQDLVTKYVPDARGRIAREIVDPAGLALTTTYAYDLNNNKISITDPRGHPTTFTYDSFNRLVATTYPAAGTSAGNLPAKVRTLYDSNGNVALTIDEEGRHVIHHHDARNRVIRTIVDMDAAGLPTVPDASLPQILLENNRGTATTDDLVTERTYNAVGAVLTETDPRGYVKRHFYDALQRLRHTYTHYQTGDANSDGTENGSAVANSSEKTHTEYLYQPVRNPGAGAFATEGWKPTQVINHAWVHTKTGVRTLNSHFHYDAVYRDIQKQIEYEPSLFSTTTTAYGAITSGKEALVTTTTDARAKVTRTYLDGLNRVMAIQDAVGTPQETETFTHYSSTGLEWLQEDPLGRLTETEYDRAGRPVKVWSPDPVTGLINRQPPGDTPSGSPVIETVYDAAGNIVATLNPRGLRWDYTFDARNRKTHELAPATVDAAALGSPSVRGLRTTHYDGVGNVLELIDPRGASTVTTYDRANRPVTVTSAPVEVHGLTGTHALVTTTTHDKAGNAVVVEDQGGNRTVNFYDALNRVTAVATNPGTGAPSQIWGSPATGDIRVLYGYDDAGNRTLVTDGEGGQTGLRYDGLARNTQTIWDIGKTLQRTKTTVYDGQVLVSRTDEKGQVTEYTYDALHRLSSVTYVGRTLDNRSQTYDAVGNLLTVTYPNDASTPRAVTQVFDHLNRVVTETSAGVTHAYTYDRAGNRLATTYGQTGRTITSTYDGLERLSQMTETDGVTTHVTAYHYDLNGNIVGHELGNGVVVARVFDALNRQKLVSNTADGEIHPFVSFAYGYDELGNVRQIAETYPAGNLPNRTVTNTYDAKHRLVEEQAVTAGSGTVTTAYAYDDADNRASKTVTGGSSPGATTYAYGDGTSGTGANSNQLISFTKPDTSVVTFTYDANGNRATRVEGVQTDTYVYDYENRLVTLDYQTGAADLGEYVYAYDHRTRRVLRDESDVGGRDLSLIVFSGGTSVQEHTTVVSASPEVEYVRGSDYGGGIGGLLYSVRSTGASFNHYNSRGDVIAKTDGLGALTYEGQYEAFGKRTEEIGTNIDRQTANTKDEDPHGLLNEGARYRCLETGTYITRDPAGFVDGPNVYTYVVQNPWTKFDQEGQFWSAIVTVGFAAFDTYQYATGQISGKEYAANMAINAVALAADAATGGMGGGVAVRTAAVAARAGKAGQAAIKATVAADRAINKTENVISVIENGGAAVEAAKEGRWSDAALAAGSAGMSARGNGASGPNGKSARITQQESKSLAGDKTYQTYTKTNPQTGEVYSGRTSGTGTPAENVANRDAAHHMNEKGFGPAKLDKSSTNKDAIRGREQKLIENHGGAKSQGGSSGNAINSVAPANPKKEIYSKAAEVEFGKKK